MKTLTQIVNESNSELKNTIDGHIHLFDYRHPSVFAQEGCTTPFTKFVGFLDVIPTALTKHVECLPYYDEFISNQYNDNMILLATGTSAQDMIAIAEKYPKIIKGFGEIKCYNKWHDKPLKLKGLRQYWDVFSYAAEHNMPVYIHYSLTTKTDVERFEACLKRFSRTKFVLCHCGMDEFQENHDTVYYRLVQLMSNHSNLYTDISFKALPYFANNPLRISQMPLRRVIVGSDINPYMYSTKKADEMQSNIYKNLRTIDNFVQSDSVLTSLFNLGD